MEIDGGNDVQILDTELLQLPGLSPVSLKENPHIAEELFSQWLSLPETGRLVILFPSLWLSGSLASFGFLFI